MSPFAHKMTINTTNEIVLRPYDNEDRSCYALRGTSAGTAQLFFESVIFVLLYTGQEKRHAGSRGRLFRLCIQATRLCPVRPRTLYIPSLTDSYKAISQNRLYYASVKRQAGRSWRTGSAAA